MLSLTEFTALFDTYAREQFQGPRWTSLYAPVRYIMNLGGKRLRPFCVYAGYGLYAAEVPYVLPLAYTLELFHNFTLVHDDIMDEAPLRRGQATVHQQFGLPAAILTGDVMMMHCYRILQENYPSTLAHELSSCLTKAAIGICEGQQADMDFEQADHISTPQYLEMIRLKTAILLGCAFQTGALAGGASADLALILEKFGTATGMAFQIQDDWLDVFGGLETGKQKAGDVVQKKKNYLYVKALDLLPADEQAGFIRLYRNDDHLPTTERVHQVLTLYESLNISAQATAEMEHWTSLAYAALQQLSLPPDHLQAFHALTQLVMQRKY